MNKTTEYDPADARTWPYEEDDVFQLGDAPGENHGWECAGCQGASGLRYGSMDEARRGLAAHQENDHAEPR